MRCCRGLTLLELILALVITALVAGAIASMMGAVALGVSSRRDGRETMIRASAASARIEAYVAPSRCVLDIDNDQLLTLWFSDARESGTVHATEIRWIVYDPKLELVELQFVEFPPSWTQVKKDLADLEYAKTADWAGVLAEYELNEWIVHMTLIERVSDASVTRLEKSPQDCEHLVVNLSFLTSNGSADVTIGATIRLHAPPDS